MSVKFVRIELCEIFMDRRAVPIKTLSIVGLQGQEKCYTVQDQPERQLIYCPYKPRHLCDLVEILYLKGR